MMLPKNSALRSNSLRFLIRPRALLALAAAGLMAAAASPAAAQNLVENGTFSITGGSTAFTFGGFAPYGPGESLADWTYIPSGSTPTTSGAGFDFVSGQTNADYSSGLQQILPTAITAPGNSNFVGVNANWGGATASSGISQSISGLTPGATYTLSFAWAVTQWYGYTGSDQAAWTVTLGSATPQSTSTTTIPAQGFSGWVTSTFTYVASTTTETLTLLATSGSGQPPLALLTNVSLTKAPEPMSIALLGTGLLGIIAAARTRRGGATIA